MFGGGEIGARKLDIVDEREVERKGGLVRSLD